jgi:hypothetical protein
MPLHEVPPQASNGTVSVVRTGGGAVFAMHKPVLGAFGACALTAGLALTGCGSAGHKANTGPSASASSSPTQVTSSPTESSSPTQVTSSPTESSSPTQQSTSSSEEHPATADVQLLGCKLTDNPLNLPDYHSGNFRGVADLKVTNHSTKVSDYLIEVEFVNAQGDRLDTGLADVTKLAPGQSQNNGDEDATGTKSLGAGAKITCRILSVDRSASS